MTGDNPELEIAERGEEGPVVLFLHGLGGNTTSWEPQLRSMAARFRCRAWTMPGYGRSPAPDPFSFAALADVAARHLESPAPEPATVVGHSMGGYVAQELALRHPALVSRLVLAGTTAAFGKPGSEFNRRFLAARLAPLDDGLTPADLAPTMVPTLVHAESANEAAVRDAVETMSAIEPEAYRRALELLVTWDARERLPAISCPTLCLAGEFDTTAPPRSVERLAETIPGARLEVLAGVGHLMNAEAPDAFTDLVAGFAADRGQP